MAEDDRRDLAESTRILQEVLALVNRKRVRAGQRPLKVVEERAA